MALGPGRMTVALGAALALHVGAALQLTRAPEAEGAQTSGAGGLGFGVATLGGSETVAPMTPDPTETQDQAEPLEAETVHEAVEADTVKPEVPVEAVPAPVKATTPEAVGPVDQAQTPPAETLEPVEAAEVAPDEPEPVEAETVEIAEPEDSAPVEETVPQVIAAEPVEIVKATSDAAQAPPPRRPRAIPPRPPKPERRVVRQSPRQAPARPARRAAAPRQAAAPAASGAATGLGDQGGAGQAQAGGGDPAAKRGYLAQLHAEIARNKRYPNAARMRRQEGEGVLRLTIDASGALVSARLRRSTGHKALDDEILRMAARAAPFPRFPAGLGGPSVTVDIPVPFRLR